MRGSPLSGTRKAPPPFTAEHRANLSASRIGHAVSEETRAKLSAIFKPRIVSKETRLKIAAAVTGKKRKPFTAETRARMSAASLGRVKSDAHRANLSKALRGRKQTPEAIAKRAASNVGKHGSEYSEEERARRTKERAERWKQSHRDLVREMGRRGAATHRARKAAAFVDRVDPGVVFDRDHGVCGICGEAVQRNERWDVDHVIPLSKGGAHSYANVQLAHSTCNKRKSATMNFVLAQVAS